MSRQPIQVEMRGLMTPRERVWQSIRKQAARFTVPSVHEMCRPVVGERVVSDYIVSLEKAGFVECVSTPPPKTSMQSAPVVYRLKDKAPFDAPRVSRDGAIVVQGMANTSMWRAMKVLKTFDYHEIAKAASLGDAIVKPLTAQQYVNALGRVGILTCVSPSKPGTAARWRLAKNTGPHAPAITSRKAVFDRNTGKFAELETAQEVCDAQC